MRYSKYQQIVCEGIIEPEKFPPTERAAWFHGLRVHLQIIQWKMLDEKPNLNSRRWDWKLENCILSPRRQGGGAIKHFPSDPMQV